MIPKRLAPFPPLGNHLKRRHFSNHQGAIVLPPEFFENELLAMRQDDPALARRLERWLNQRTRGSYE